MKSIFILLFLLLSGNVRAQEVSFVVYHAQGQSTINGKPLSLKKGDKLTGSDVVTIGKGAKLVLICSNYNAIQLSTPGRVNAKSLLQRCQEKTGSYTASYFKYVWEEFTHPHGYPDKDPTKFMRNSGAVSRGCNQVETKLLTDTVIYAEGPLPINFNTSIPSPYLTVYSEAENGEVIGQWKIKGNMFALDSVKSVFKKPATYYWQITDDNAQGCPPNVLSIVPNKEYNAAIQKILPKKLSLPAAEEAFLKGYLLEEAFYLAEAKKYYDLAVRLDPKNEAYKQAQSRFYE